MLILIDQTLLPEKIPEKILIIFLSDYQINFSYPLHLRVISSLNIYLRTEHCSIDDSFFIKVERVLI